MTRLLRVIVAAGAALLAMAASAPAQMQGPLQGQYPNKPITLIVPFGPGSTTDTISPHHCAASRTRAQPEHRHREQAGRERRHRRRLCRPRRTRWLHAADEHQQPAFGRAHPHQERRLRSGKGLRAGHAHRKLHVDAGAASGCAGEVRSGADRLRQGQSRQAVVCERQHIRRRGRRNAQGLGRHQPRACALSKHAAGGQ